MPQKNNAGAHVVPFASNSVSKAKSLLETTFIQEYESVNGEYKVNRLHSDFYRPTPSARADISPPSYVTDVVALEEWGRVAPLLREHGTLTPMMDTLLAGYCNALSRSVRAEKIIEKEGQYYSTKTSAGSTLKRRHPAAKDAEDGWGSVVHFAKQIDRYIVRQNQKTPYGSRTNIFK